MLCSSLRLLSHLLTLRVHYDMRILTEKRILSNVLKYLSLCEKLCCISDLILSHSVYNITNTTIYIQHLRNAHSKSCDCIYRNYKSNWYLNLTALHLFHQLVLSCTVNALSIEPIFNTNGQQCFTKATFTITKHNTSNIFEMNTKHTTVYVESMLQFKHCQA